MIGQTNKKILAGRLQRRLRNDMTHAERVLWRVLRTRQVSGIKFRRQHPYGNYILDFVSLEIKLIIEIDGGQHGKQTEYDAIRTSELQAAGFQVLRFWNNEVLQDIEAVKDKIWIIVQERVLQKQSEGQMRQQAHPHPNPPLEGEGE
jgi:very-short-patch-repair endonuclease